MNINILIIISCICLLFIIGKIFIVPIKWILKLVFNSILGGILIWVINLIGGTIRIPYRFKYLYFNINRTPRNTRSRIIIFNKIIGNLK